MKPKKISPAYVLSQKPSTVCLHCKYNAVSSALSIQIALTVSKSKHVFDLWLVNGLGCAC